MLGVSLACASMTKEELACEEAASRLIDCCPGFDARRMPCVESEGGGCNKVASPVLTERASSCILDTSCDALRGRGSCDNLIALSLVPHALKDTQAIETEACK
jgi:hypothetical protein